MGVMSELKLYQYDENVRLF